MVVQEQEGTVMITGLKVESSFFQMLPRSLPGRHFGFCNQATQSSTGLAVRPALISLFLEEGGQLPGPIYL